MVLSHGFRAGAASCARQRALKITSAAHATPPRFSIPFGSLIARSLVCQRSFSTSKPFSARSSPLLYHPRRSNKSDDLADHTEGEEAAEDQGKRDEAKLEGSEDEGPSGSSAQSAPPSSSSDGDGGDGSEPPLPTPLRTPSPSSIAKQSVPEVYPRVLALPIARRPLFPGFYKAVVIRNPSVVAAIKEMMKRGQPYLGAFLLKDENTDSDVITDINSVHQVGVFAQITSIFAANTGSGEDKDEGLTAVLYPHRRIKMTDLIKAGEQLSTVQVPLDEAQTPSPPPSPDPGTSESDIAKIPPGQPSIVSCWKAFFDAHIRASTNVLLAQACYLHCASREPRHATLQQGRPVHSCVHVGNRIRIQGHRPVEPTVPRPDHEFLDQSGCIQCL